MQEGPCQGPPRTCSALKVRPPHVYLTLLTPVLALPLRERGIAQGCAGVEHLQVDMKCVASGCTPRWQPGSKPCFKSFGSAQMLRKFWNIHRLTAASPWSSVGGVTRGVILLLVFSLKIPKPQWAGQSLSHFPSALEGPFPSTLPRPAMRVLV